MVFVNNFENMITKNIIEILIRTAVFINSLNFVKVEKSGSHRFKQMVKKHSTPYVKAKSL